MKQFKLASMIVTVVIAIAAISCSPVRYDEGYDVGVYSSSPAYYGVDPYIGYYTPSPYYSVPYYGDTYYRGTVRPRREYRERRDDRREERREVRPEVNDNRSYREQNNRVYQNNQPVQHYKGNPLQYLQQQKRNNDRH